MVTQLERLSINETKIDTLEEKIDDLKEDVRAMRECLDRTRDSIMASIKEMSEVDQEGHKKMAEQISSLEKFKTKWIYLSAGAIAVLGWLSPYADTIIKSMI